MTQPANRDAAFRSALERLPLAVLIVDGERRLEAYNRRAKALFETESLRGDLLDARPGHPLSVLIRTILDSPTTDLAEQTITFPSDRCYRVEPSRRSEKGGRWLMLLISEADHPVPRDLEALGLTPRERDVAQAMLEGKSSAEACEALAISRDTLKTHMRRVFEKSGCRNRAEFAVRMLRRR